MKYRTIRHFNKEGYIHKSKGPAMISHNTDKAWFRRGQAHRLDGPYFISKEDAYYEWGINGQYYGSGIHPPEAYLKELERLGIKFIRGSDDIE